MKNQENTVNVTQTSVTLEATIKQHLADTLSHDNKEFSHLQVYIKDLKAHNTNAQTLNERYKVIKALIKNLKGDENHKKAVTRSVSLAYDYIAFNLVSSFDNLHYSTVSAMVKTAKQLEGISRGDDKKNAIGTVQLKRHNEQGVTLMSIKEALELLKNSIATVYTLPEFKGQKFTATLKTSYNNTILKSISAINHDFKIVEDENGNLVTLKSLSAEISEATLSLNDIDNLIQLLNSKKQEANKKVA